MSRKGAVSRSSSFAVFRRGGGSGRGVLQQLDVSLPPARRDGWALRQARAAPRQPLADGSAHR